MVLVLTEGLAQNRLQYGLESHHLDQLSYVRWIEKTRREQTSAIDNIFDDCRSKC